MVCEPSVLPLSATMTSPGMPEFSNAVTALRMQVWRVSASFRQGMTTETSGGSSVRCVGGGLGLMSSWLTVDNTVTRLDKVIQTFECSLASVVYSDELISKEIHEPPARFCVCPFSLPGACAG